MANPFDLNNYMRAAMIRESSGNPDARSRIPGQTASGLYGFTTPTYLGVARKLNPGIDDQSLLSMKNDPNTQNAVMKAFTQQNIDNLTNSGLPVTNGSVYLSHFLGAGGAKNVLSADDNTPISQVVSPEALKANQSVFSKAPTVGALKQWAEAVNGGGGDSSQPSSPMQTAMAGGAPGGSAPQADLPVEGGQETAQQTGQNGFAPPPAPQSTWDQVMSGGPGALFGAPQKDWSAGDALTGAGIAMMARDNPQGAAALAAMMRNGQKNKTQNGKSVKIDPATGKAYIYDDQGNVQVKQIDAAQEKPLAEGTRKAFQVNQEKVDNNAYILDKMNFWRDKIANKELDVTAVTKLGNNWRELIGNGDPKTAMAAQFAADMEDMRNNRLLEAKGVQTEGDAARAMKAILPGNAALDNKTTLGMLDRAATELRYNHDRFAGYNIGIAKNHKDADPDGMFLNPVKDRQAGWDSWQQQYSPRHDAFMSSGSMGGGATGQPTGPNGGDPMKQHKESFGSFARRR